jgi:hypothetical protein
VLVTQLQWPSVVYSRSSALPTPVPPLTFGQLSEADKDKYRRQLALRNQDQMQMQMHALALAQQQQQHQQQVASSGGWGLTLPGQIINGSQYGAPQYPGYPQISTPNYANEELDEEPPHNDYDEEDAPGDGDEAEGDED